MEAKISGEVLLQFVFTAAGRVDTTSVIELRSTNPLFANAVRGAMSQWTGEPALRGADAMPQWVAIDVRFQPQGCGGVPNPPVIASTALLCVTLPDKQ
ncbi:MAG TPA: TonB family protein [Gemmatimonadaceae bacterium]